MAKESNSESPEGFRTSDEGPRPSAEFRRYRRLLSWLILGFVSLGSTYLLVSVGVTIYRRRNAVPTGAPIGAQASTGDVESCAEELSDVEKGLERHLENFHGLLAHYDPSEAQRWDEDRAFWLGQWKAAGERCRYNEPRPGRHRKNWEELAVVHSQLQAIESTYHRELVRFGQTEAPRLNSIRERLETVGRRIRTAPETVAAPKSGDINP
jgi:hypothetical protein